MDKRGKVALSVVALFVILVSISCYFVFAAETNTKSYDSSTRTISIKNGATDVADIKLNTPTVYNVIRGKNRLVAEFTIDNYVDYSNVFNDMEFYGIKNNMNEFSRVFSYKYKTYYNVEIPDYETSCKERTSINGSLEKYDCVQNQIGTHIEQKTKWNNFNKDAVLPAGSITLGIFTDVLPNEEVEWVPTLFGVRIDEWAQWTEALNTELIGYWGMNEGTGLNVAEERFGINNLTTYVRTNWTTSAMKEYALSFSAEGSKAESSSGTAYNLLPSENKTISFWYNTSFLDANYNVIMGKHSYSSNKGWDLIEGTTGGDLYFHLVDSWGGDKTIEVYWDNVIVADGLYAHYVLTYNASEGANGTELYVNGIKKTRINSWDGTVTDSSTQEPFYLGDGEDGGYIQGILDEIAIWNRTLTPSEISYLYDDGIGTFYTASAPDNSPVITLNTPINYMNFSSSSVTFNCSATDDYKIQNISLWINGQRNYTFQDESDNFTSLEISRSLADGIYNWSCSAEDNATIPQMNMSSNRTLTVDTTPPQTTTPIITPANPETSDDLECYATLTDNRQTNLVAYWKWYKNDVSYLSGNTNTTNGIYSLITTLDSGNTTRGDNWTCEVLPFDGNYGNAVNSSVVEIGWAIMFNVTDSYYGTGLNNVLISCNQTGFTQEGDTTNSYGPYGFPNGNYECTFSRTTHFDKLITFIANNDITVEVKMSEGGKLTVEEHTWLEAIYNCLYSGDCSLYNLLLEMNQTIGKIWEHTKPTDGSVITFENITNRVVDANDDLTINYTVNIPIKGGYVSGTYLPVRIGFWFLNEANTTCYNQGDKPTGVEEPYCQPLIIETLGPMGGSINFTVKLHPQLPAGNYSIKRIIDIDPNNAWINYGQELIGSFIMLESSSSYGIAIEKTEENNPTISTNQQQSSSLSSGSSERSSKKITNVYNTYNTIQQEPQTPPSEEVIHLNNPTATGGIIGSLLSESNYLFVISVIGLFVIIVISRTIFKIKKKVINILFIFLGIFFILYMIIASNISFIEDINWGQNLTSVRFGAMVVGDLDNNGYLDVISTGCLLDGANDCENGVVAKVYTNNKTSFLENQTWGNNLTGVGLSSLALGDIDNDGDLDLALTGCDSSINFNCYGNFYAKIYINNGTSLIENSQWQNNLIPVTEGSLSWGDVDNDGDLDLAQIGARTSPPSLIAKIYINNETNLIESQQWQNGLGGVQRGNIVFGDVDNDGRLDLVLSGYNEALTEITKIYINNGTSLVESQIWQQNLIPEGESSVLLGNYNNDEFLDLLTCGHTTGDHCYLYKNNGTMLELNQTRDDGLPAIYSASIAFGDYDNDGDLDLVGMGWEHGRTKVCENNETNNYYFQNDPIAHLNISDDLFMGSLVFGDFDKENDLDLITTGIIFSSGLLSSDVYLSNTSLTKNNTLPTPPSIFTSVYSIENNTLTLGWNNGSDAETPSLGLYYNLMVGNSTNNHTIVSGVYGGESGSNEGGSGGANGYFGNMMQRKNITLNLILAAGTYYWYVQTIDTGLAKGNWSARQSFTVNADTTAPAISNVVNSSITSSSAIISWNTDEMANSTVHYGTTTATTSKSNDISLTMSHSISLSGLSASTLYYYNVSSCDDSGNCNTSQQYSFTTSNATQSENPPSGGGGGGSGTTSFWTKTETVNDANFSVGVEKELSAKQRLSVNVAGESHYIGVISVSNISGTATINISSNPIQITLGIGEEKKVDVSNDSWYDIYLKLVSILGNKANLTIRAIHEQVSSGIQNQSEIGGEEIPSEEEKGKKCNDWLWIAVGIALVLAADGIVFYLLKVKRKGKEGKMGKNERRDKRILRREMRKLRRYKKWQK